MKSLFFLLPCTFLSLFSFSFCRFGSGLHRVEVTVEFFQDVSYQGSGLVAQQVPERYLVIELAPVNLMPHAVHLFLEQVEQ